MKYLKWFSQVLIIIGVTLSFSSCSDAGKTQQKDTEKTIETGVVPANHEEHSKTDGSENMESHDHSDHDHGDHDHGGSSETKKRNIEVSSNKNASTAPIIDAYIQIKNALVETDKSAAAKGGTALLSAFSEFDMTVLKGDAHIEYMEILENAKEQAEHIVKSPVDHQREHFEVLSTDINDLITLLGTDKTLYQDFCPMANDGKGASWLSEFKDIKNPYYGSKMLKCGKIQKVIN